MASQPAVPAPDRIEPQSPPETPATPTPAEDPAGQPDEISPPQPDTISPGAPMETPMPPD